MLRKFIIIPLLCLYLPCSAHHYKGLPHYSYFDNYPQVPILEFIKETPRYELFVTIYNFQGLNLDMVEAPDDVRFYIYIFDVEANKTYLGPADFEIYSHGKLVARDIGLRQEEESIYSLRKKIKEQDDLIMKASFLDMQGAIYTIEMPIQITQSYIEQYGVYLAVAGFFFLVMAIKVFSPQKKQKIYKKPRLTKSAL